MDVVEMWRVTDKKYEDIAFSGEANRLWGGRFNSSGVAYSKCNNSAGIQLCD